MTLFQKSDFPRNVIMPKYRPLGIVVSHRVPRITCELKHPDDKILRAEQKEVHGLKKVAKLSIAEGATAFRFWLTWLLDFI